MVRLTLPACLLLSWNLKENHVSTHMAEVRNTYVDWGTNELMAKSADFDKESGPSSGSCPIVVDSAVSRHVEETGSDTGTASPKKTLAG